MKNTLLFIVLLMAAISCDKSTTQADLCEGVICNNGGNCVNGDCACPPQYTGPDCGQEKVPVKMRAGSISLVSFPLTDTNGAGWDVFDGPDVFIQITQGSTVVYTSGFVEDLTTGHTYTDMVEFISPQATYTVSVWDYDDGLTAPDLLGGVNFTPYQSGLDFPTFLPIQCGGCTVALSLNNITYTH